MKQVRKIVLALALVTMTMVGGIGVPIADASHNPTVGCWYYEGTNPGDPAYGPHWQHFDDGWWYFYWWQHLEECEDGSWDDLGWHQHWHYYGW